MKWNIPSHLYETTATMLLVLVTLYHSPVCVKPVHAIKKETAINQPEPHPQPYWPFTFNTNHFIFWFSSLVRFGVSLLGGFFCWVWHACEADWVFIRLVMCIEGMASPAKNKTTHLKHIFLQGLQRVIGHHSLSLDHPAIEVLQQPAGNKWCTL